MFVVISDMLHLEAFPICSLKLQVSSVLDPVQMCISLAAFRACSVVILCSESLPFETWRLEQKLTDRVGLACWHIASNQVANQPVKPVWPVVMLCFDVWETGHLTCNSPFHMSLLWSGRNMENKWACTYAHRRYTACSDHLLFCLHLALC